MSESNIIQMPFNAPNLISDQEKGQWLKGKPSREEVLSELTAISNEIHLDVAKQSNRISNLEANLGKVAAMTRMNTLQNETLLIIFDKVVPNFRSQYKEQLMKAIAMVKFLDTINTPDNNEPKPMREKIELARQYNAIEGNSKILGNYILLDGYIKENPNEFSEEEVIALSEEFEMDITITKEPVPVQGE